MPPPIVIKTLVFWPTVQRLIAVRDGKGRP